MGNDRYRRFRTTAGVRAVFFLRIYSSKCILLFSPMSELRKEADALEKAIIAAVQQVQPLTPTEEAQLKEWRRRFAIIRQELGVVLTPSERLRIVSDPAS